jgi:hypothetical protein
LRSLLIRHAGEKRALTNHRAMVLPRTTPLQLRAPHQASHPAPTDRYAFAP